MGKNICVSLKLKAKNLFFRFMDLLPEGLGFRGYHFLQKKMGAVSLDQQIRSTTSSYQNFLRLTEKMKITIEGRKVLEIGSGWLPLLPYFFKFMGKADAVYTYDLNQHFDPKKVRSLNHRFSEEFGFKVAEEEKQPFGLPGDISYFPKTDISKASLPPVEVVFSRFVLEHVEPEAMLRMHQKFKRELKKGSHVVHFISPSDHRAYVDKTLSLQDFLQYSQEEWDKKQTKFDYHNRWRLPQYVALFEALGYEIVHLEYDVPGTDSEAFAKFSNVDLHQDFKRYSKEELMAGAINIILRV